MKYRKEIIESLESEKENFQNPENKHMLVGRREITLSKDHIIVWTPVAETAYQWSAVTKLGQSINNYFLYLGSTQAIIISKNAFENEQEKLDFEKLAASKIDHRKN